MRVYFHQLSLVLPDRIVPDGCLLVEDGRIAVVASADQFPAPADAQQVSLDGGYLGPGFVDIHCHGGGGVWVHEHPQQAADAQLAHGTTSMLATTLALATPELNLAAVQTIGDAASAGRLPNVIGIHMEGPYLNPDLGAYKELSRRPEPAEYLGFARAAQGWLRTMTIAPELDGMTQLVTDLQAATGGAMTFSVGHSKASAAQIYALIPAGLRLATHLGNATGCHREPSRFAGTREFGVDEAVLAEPGIFAEVIADEHGAHLRPEMLRYFWQVKGPDRIVAVTDATNATGRSSDSAPPSDVNYNDNGDLAGSALTMERAVSNLMRHAGLSLDQAWRAGSFNPASALGMAGQVGQLAPGRRANLVAARLADGQLQIEQVWLNGSRVQPDAVEGEPR